MLISTIQDLEDLANEDTDVYDILNDYELGRRSVSAKLGWILGYSVSEHLIRTWRNNQKQNKPEYESELAGIKQAEERINSYYTQASSPIFDGLNYINGSYMSPKPVKKDKDKKVIAFGDFQINKHDPEFLAKSVDLLKDQQPDIVCLTGDESDNSAVGRWAKGMREEFESNLQDQIDETIEWLIKIREAVPNAEIHMADSNHMGWITKAIETRLPGFATLRALTPEKLYQLDELEINYQRKLFEFLPNFILGHGHQWNLSSSSHKTKGIEHVMRTGCSILAGHVHQATLQTVFIGYEGKGEQKVYVNPGCMMDFEKAMASNGGYLSGTSPNWSKGIVVITREAGQNYTELLLGQNDGTFRYEGKRY
jgi:hypothetical protein